ncbi:HypC/HybG/HupF family hydrogenase formation chaperone [Cyanobium sp. ATX 6A2]|nr:HypC/HybG/HupF family hydrogenase formation chaperone [Cyanobium sp. ATX 6A2]
MCLATPGVILVISDGQPPAGTRAADGAAGAAAAADSLWRCAEVDFGGVRQQVSLACLPEAVVGDRVLVHVGVALSLVEDDDPPWPADRRSHPSSASQPSAPRSDDGHPVQPRH